MPTLDYAQSPPKLWRRRTFKTSAAALLLIALVVVACKVPTWYQQWKALRLANAYRLIDAEIPGTEVYFRDKLLGTTPLVLSKADCAAVGLPVAPGTVVDSEGWGEGLVFHDPTTNSDPRLMFKVPSSQAGSFLSYATPWGSRTKMNGGWGLPNGFRSRFMSRGQNGIGVIVSVDFDSKPGLADRLLKVNVSATNNGTGAFSGFRPEVEVLWGTFDVQWQHRSHKTFKLPAEWATIGSGQTFQTRVEIPLPEAKGDYSVFATLNLFRNEKEDYLVGAGSVYSDSKLLHIP